MQNSNDIDTSLFPSQDDALAAQQIWSDGKTQAAQDNPVGNFAVLIEEAALGRSASSDRLQISYKLKILQGQFAGKTIRKYDGLASPQQAKITQQQLQRLGVDVKNLSMQQLPAVLLSLVGKAVQVTAKQNGQYYNILFNRILTPGAGEASAGIAAAATGSGSGQAAPFNTAGPSPSGRSF